MRRQAGSGAKAGWAGVKAGRGWGEGRQWVGRRQAGGAGRGQAWCWGRAGGRPRKISSKALHLFIKSLENRREKIQNEVGNRRKKTTGGQKNF
jgi:hypothetical protein